MPGGVVAGDVDAAFDVGVVVMPSPPTGEVGRDPDEQAAAPSPPSIAVATSRPIIQAVGGRATAPYQVRR